MLLRRTFLAAMPFSTISLNALSAISHPGVKQGCQTNAWRIDPGNFSQLLQVLANLKELRFDGFETSFRNLQSQFNNVLRHAR